MNYERLLELVGYDPRSASAVVDNPAAAKAAGLELNQKPSEYERLLDEVEDDPRTAAAVVANPVVAGLLGVTKK